MKKKASITYPFKHIKTGLLTSAALASVLSAGCASDQPPAETAATTSAPAVTQAVSDTPEETSKPADSGKITVPLEEENASVRNAPAYDTAKAKTYIDVMPEIRQLVDNIGDDKELTAFGSAKPSEEALNALSAELASLTSDGHKVSLVMVDVESKSGVAFNSELKMCTQSTVKGVYVGSVLESIPDSLERNGMYMHDAIVFSDNDAYMALRDIYGSEPILKWCEKAGVSSTFAEKAFPRDSSSRDMLKLWTLLYCFLNSDSENASFARYFADSAVSPTRRLLGGRFPVQTKAGWESGLNTDLNYDPEAKIEEKCTDGDPSNDECATNDTGVVYTPDGPYLFVIYSDFPFGVFADYTPENKLDNLVELLNDVQASYHK